MPYCSLKPRLYSQLCASVTISAWHYHWPRQPRQLQLRRKATFKTHHGTNIFKTMPYGLKNAPSTFQRALEVILSQVKWKFSLAYLDHSSDYTQTFDEHISHLKHVLRLLREAGMSTRLHKCFFFTKTDDCLGHVFLPRQLQCLLKRIDAVQVIKPPRNVSDI